MGLYSVFYKLSGNLFVYLVTLFSVFGLSSGDNVCVVGDKLEFCEYGCCDGKCCNISTIAIVGAVIGAVLGLITLIACGFCLYHMCKKKKSRGTNVQPYNNNQVYVHNNPYGGHMGHPPPRPNPPPSYSQASAYPPYNPPGFDPAYPPGAVAHPPPAYSYSDPTKK